MGVRSAQERPVEGEFAWLREGKERQDDPGDVGMPDVLAAKEGEDHEGEQFDLVLAELREVLGEAAGQLGEDIRGRVLFSRISRTCASLSRRGRGMSGEGPGILRESPLCSPGVPSATGRMTSSQEIRCV